MGYNEFCTHYMVYAMEQEKKLIRLTGTDALQVRKSGEEVRNITIVDEAPAEVKKKAHRDGVQFIPERTLMFNTQFAGAVIDNLVVEDTKIESDGLLQCLFISDGAIRATIRNNTLDTAGQHYISLCLLSGEIENNRDAAGNLVPVRLFPMRWGGNSDGKLNVYILSFKNPKYRYHPVSDIVKDETLHHVTDHRFGKGRRKDSIYLYNFDIDAAIAETELKQLTADQMRDMAIKYGSLDEPIEQAENNEGSINMTVEDSQRYLSWLGLYLGVIDGKHGRKTQAALDEFMEHEGWDGDIEAKLLKKMERFTLPVSSDKYGLADAVKIVCSHMYRESIHYPSYIMATCEHETAGQLVPLREGDHLSPGAADRHRETLSYKPWFAHGYVGLTHDYNFRKYGVLLGVGDAFVDDPMLTLDKSVALFILVHGMITGAFTGRKLDQYLVNGSFDAIQARRIVNGVRPGDTLPDRALDIAKLYEKWKAYYEQ